MNIAMLRIRPPKKDDDEAKILRKNECRGVRSIKVNRHECLQSKKAKFPMPISTAFSTNHSNLEAFLVGEIAMIIFGYGVDFVSVLKILHTVSDLDILVI